MNNNISQSISSNSKKKKWRFNIIDFIIVVLILLLIATLIYAFSPISKINQMINTDTVEVLYAVEIRGVDAQFINMIKEGDSVVNSVNKNSLGSVRSIESVTNSMELGYVRDASQVAQGVLVAVPDKFDITVYISAEADYEAGTGYSIGGCRVAVGEELFLRFPEYACSGYCTIIDADS